MNNKIIIERTLNAPPEKVWLALTQEEQLKKWLIKTTNTSTYVECLK
jgi:uncharacterized protein YndB with AHSA1/START domain